MQNFQKKSDIIAGEKTTPLYADRRLFACGNYTNGHFVSIALKAFLPPTKYRMRATEDKEWFTLVLQQVARSEQPLRGGEWTIDSRENVTHTA